VLRLTEYKVKTLNHDWSGICTMNGVDFESFWTKREFVVLTKVLKAEEVVLGFTAGTVQLFAQGKISSLGKDSWLVVLSTERIILINSTNPKVHPKVKSIAIKKVSGIVASQNKALGQLVIVLEGGIVTIDNAMVNTVRSIEKIFGQIKEVDEEKVKIEPVQTKSLENKSDCSAPKEKEVAPSQKITNPFADEVDEENLDEDLKGKISISKAAIVAFLLGKVGIHDFVWGRPIFGVEKAVLFIACLITSYKCLHVISSLILLGLVVWVLVDILRMFSEKYFHNRPCREVPRALRVGLIIVCIIEALVCGGNLFSDIYDSTLKDFGGHVQWYEIMDAYNNRSIATKKRFEKRRFSIIATVGSINKTTLGNYEVELEGPSAVPKNFSNEIQSMILIFPHSQFEPLEKMQKGNVFAASCIGRGSTLGTYTADKCVLKHVKQYR